MTLSLKERHRQTVRQRQKWKIARSMQRKMSEKSETHPRVIKMWAARMKRIFLCTFVCACLSSCKCDCTLWWSRCALFFHSPWREAIKLKRTGSKYDAKLGDDRWGWEVKRGVALEEKRQSPWEGQLEKRLSWQAQAWLSCNTIKALDCVFTCFSTVCICAWNYGH